MTASVYPTLEQEIAELEAELAEAQAAYNRTVDGGHTRTSPVLRGYDRKVKRVQKALDAARAEQAEERNG